MSVFSAYYPLDYFISCRCLHRATRLSRYLRSLCHSDEFVPTPLDMGGDLLALAEDTAAY